MSTRLFSLIICAAALLAAGGCNSFSGSASEDGAIKPDPKNDPQATLKSIQIFRCDDRSLLYVDFMADGLSARLKRKPTDLSIELRASAPGEPFVAEQYSISADGKKVEVRRTNRAAIACVP